MANRGCMLVFCPNTGKIPGLSYFRLTKNRYQPWLEALGWDPEETRYSYSSVLCSAHFDKSDIQITPQGHMSLKLGAIPKFNLGPNVEYRRAQRKARGKAIPKLFPDDVDRRKLWLNALQMDTAKKWHYICSRHFHKSDYYLTKTNIQMLKNDAVPSPPCISKTTSRKVNIDTLKNVPAVGRIPYEEFYSENEWSSDSSSTDTASETKYHGIHIESSVSAGQNPSKEVMETTIISSPASDSSTDSASETGYDALVTPSHHAEQNSVKAVIKQEISEQFVGALSNAPILGDAKIHEQFQSAADSQMQLDTLNPEIKQEVKQEVKQEIPDQTIPVASISDEQFIEMLEESESTLLTPELLLARGNKTKKRYFGDISLDDLRTQEEREYHINAQKRIRQQRTKIQTFQVRSKRITKRLEQMNEIVNMVANVCDVTHIKRVLEAEVDSEESSDDNASNVGEDTHIDELSKVPPSNIGDSEENETEIDSFNFANQVQVTFLSGSDTASEDRLKKELQKVGRQDIIKSKKINKLNNTIFEKDIIIEELKSTLNKLKNDV